MNCGFCGKRSWQVAKFCGNCGARFPRQVEPINNAAPTSSALISVVQTLSLTATAIVLGGLLLFVLLLVSLAILKVQFDFILGAAIVFLLAAAALTVPFVFYSFVIIKKLLPAAPSPRSSLRHLNPKSVNEIETPREPQFSVTEAETLLFKENPFKQKANRD